MTYILPSTAERAADMQREHDLQDGGWWCKGCFRDGNGKIAAGFCDDYLWADRVLTAFRRQQAIIPRPIRGRAQVRPGEGRGRPAPRGAVVWRYGD